MGKSGILRTNAYVDLLLKERYGNGYTPTLEDCTRGGVLRAEPTLEYFKQTRHRTTREILKLDLS